MAGKSSQLSIDSDVKSNGKGNRLRMKWKAVPLWYVVFLSIMTLSNAEGRWNIIRPVMSFKGNTGDERFIVPYSGTGANNDIIGEPFAKQYFVTPRRYNPFGYALTDLGKQYLSFQGSADSDIGRFLSTLKSGRKKETTIKEQWLEIVRVSKQGQSMRIYRTLDDMIKLCLSAGFID
eukprot:scaffold7165_cov68-Cyclotella_meneghiniana.AAC.3